MGKAKRLKQRKQLLRTQKGNPSIVQEAISLCIAEARRLKKSEKGIKEAILSAFQELTDSSEKQVLIFIFKLRENGLGSLSFIVKTKDFVQTHIPELDLKAIDFETQRVVGHVFVEATNECRIGAFGAYPLNQLKADLAQFMSEQGGHQL